MSLKLIALCSDLQAVALHGDTETKRRPSSSYKFTSS